MSYGIFRDEQGPARASTSSTQHRQDLRAGEFLEPRSSESESTCQIRRDRRVVKHLYGGQGLRDHPVELRQSVRRDEDDIPRLERERGSKQKSVRRAGVEVEDGGRRVVSTDHVNLPRV